MAPLLVAVFGQALGNGPDLLLAYLDSVETAILQLQAVGEATIADRLQEDTDIESLLEDVSERFRAAFAGYVALHCDGRDYLGNDPNDPDDQTRDYRRVRYEFLRDYAYKWTKPKGPILAVRADVYHHESDADCRPTAWIFFGVWS